MWELPIRAMPIAFSRPRTPFADREEHTSRILTDSPLSRAVGGSDEAQKWLLV
jgi:hypothetical protein